MWVYQWWGERNYQIGIQQCNLELKSRRSRTSLNQRTFTITIKRNWSPSWRSLTNCQRSDWNFVPNEHDKSPIHNWNILNGYQHASKNSHLYQPWEIRWRRAQMAHRRWVHSDEWKSRQKRSRWQRSLHSNGKQENGTWCSQRHSSRKIWSFEFFIPSEVQHAFEYDEPPRLQVWVFDLQIVPLVLKRCQYSWALKRVLLDQRENWIFQIFKLEVVEVLLWYPNKNHWMPKLHQLNLLKRRKCASFPDPRKIDMSEGWFQQSWLWVGYRCEFHKESD